jgi:hypothetical protein
MMRVTHEEFYRWLVLALAPVRLFADLGDAGGLAMKQSWLVLAPFSALALSGCEIIGDIFKAGVWVGVLLAIGVVGLIIWLIAKAMG